ncbi:MAG TPA: hypothetical protein ENH40_05495 [Nitrospirae bacterium]|nr:hypothetical protein [Nitrospirota bacterium]
MQLKKIAEILEAQIVSNPDSLNKEIECACCTDLISNVLYYSSGQSSVLITGLIHPQVVRAAEVAGIEGIVFVQSRKPDTDTAKLAEQKGITLLISPFCMYTASGKLYNAGLLGHQKEQNEC